jgi:hypothetical protein
MKAIYYVLQKFYKPDLTTCNKSRIAPTEEDAGEKKTEKILETGLKLFYEGLRLTLWVACVKMRHDFSIEVVLPPGIYICMLHPGFGLVSVSLYLLVYRGQFRAQSRRATL